MDTREKRKCTLCPSEGVDCDATGITMAGIPILPNFYRITSTAPPETEVHPCPKDGACVGGNGTGNALCAFGYEGPFCSSCSSGYFYDASTASCELCKDSGGRAGILFAVAILSVVAFIIFLRRLRSKATAPSAQNRRFSSMVRGALDIARDGEVSSFEKSERGSRSATTEQPQEPEQESQGEQEQEQDQRKTDGNGSGFGGRAMS